MNREYEAGRRFEYKTRDDLFANGYAVMRAAGSKGATKADLVGFKPGQLLLVQCKSDGTLPPAEWDRLVEVAGWVGAIPLLAANGERGRGVVYTRLLGSKRRGARIQPVEPFVLDLIDAAPAGGTDIGVGDAPSAPAAPAGAVRTATDVPDLLRQLGHDPDELVASGRLACYPLDGA